MRWPLLLSGFACLLPLAAAEIPLTLERAIALALQQNRSLLNQQIALEEARISVTTRMEDLQWQPAGVLRGRRSETADSVEAGLALRRRLTTGGELQLFGGQTWQDPEDQTVVRLSASQPLLRNAGPLQSLEPLRRAERLERDARRLLHERMQEVILDVVIGYEGLLRAARQLEAENAAEARLAARVARDRVREATGQLSRLERLRNEALLEETRLRVQNQQDLLNQWADEFANLLGLSPEMRFALQPPPLLALDLPAPEEAEAIALTHRQDLARALDALEEAGRQVRIARRDLLPDLRLTGDLSGNVEGSDLSREAWFVGLVIEPDFSAGSRRAEVRQSGLRAERLEQQIEEIHRAIQLDVRGSLRNLQRAEASHRIAIRSRQVAERRLTLATRLEALEQGDARSLAEAEEAHATAVRNELTARSEASLAAYRVLRAMGTLLELTDGADR